MNLISSLANECQVTSRSSTPLLPRAISKTPPPSCLFSHQVAQMWSRPMGAARAPRNTTLAPARGKHNNPISPQTPLLSLSFSLYLTAYVQLRPKGARLAAWDARRWLAQNARGPQAPKLPSPLDVPLGLCILAALRSHRSSWDQRQVQLLPSSGVCLHATATYDSGRVHKCAQKPIPFLPHLACRQWLIFMLLY